MGALNFGFSWVGTVGRDGNRRREALSERCAHGDDSQRRTLAWISLARGRKNPRGVLPWSVTL